MLTIPHNVHIPQLPTTELSASLREFLRPLTALLPNARPPAVVEFDGAQRPDRQFHYYMFAFSPEQKGQLGLYCFASLDGQSWSLVSDQSIYPVNHDNVGVMWDSHSGRYIAQQIITCPYPAKRIIDNVNARRRILTVRAGSDGSISTGATP